MEAQKFLDNFTNITLTPKSLGEFRKFILMLATQGKLVEQDPNDEPAFDLLKRVHAQNGRDFNNTQIINENEGLFALPDGWARTYLAEIGIWRNGSGFPVSYQGKIDLPYLFCKVSDMNLLGNERYIHFTNNTIDKETAKKIGAKIHPAGTVIFPKIGGAIATNKRRILAKQSAIDNNCLGISGEGYCNSEWLYFLLMSMDFTKFQTGTSVPSISQNTLGKIKIALPPLAEQKRIVAKIEELLLLCNQLEELQLKTLNLTTSIRDISINTLVNANSSMTIFNSWPRIEDNFHAFFSTSDSIKLLRQVIYDLAVVGRFSNRIQTEFSTEGMLNLINQAKQDLVDNKVIKRQKKLPSILENEEPLPLPNTWRWIRLGELCKTIEYGTSQKADNNASGIPILRMGNIVNGKIIFANLKYVSSKIKDLPHLYLKRGDLLFNRTNSYELVGKMGLFTGEDDKFTFASYLIRVSLFDKYVMPEWVDLYFQSSICRKTQIEPNITAQTNQANFNGTKLANVIIPLAPIEEQRDIINQVNEFLHICDDLEMQLEAAADKQFKLSFTATQSIINSGSKITTDSFAEVHEPLVARRLSIEIRLSSPMKKNIKSTKLAAILKENGGKMDAKELWKASELDIDEFYALLKKEIEMGFIQEPDVAEIKLVEVGE